MSYLIHPTLNESDSRSNPKLLRIFLDKDFTRLDFGYATHSYYIKGGWFNIYPQTHLRVHGIKEPFPLTHTEGITLAPDRFHFESNKDWAYFSLYFKAIPLKSCVIDMLEEEDATEDTFNYYGVTIVLNEGMEVVGVMG
jgi:hypothetical protein